MSKILIVDDDAHILRTLEVMLLDEGHEVHCATTAEEAVEVLDTTHFDIGLVDLLLPGMDGLDLLRHIRDQSREADVIIITAHGSIETAVEAMKEGAFDYLTKPFSPEQVRQRLAHLQRVKDLRLEVDTLRRKLGEERREARFITENAAVRRVLDLARTVAEEKFMAACAELPVNVSTCLGPAAKKEDKTCKEAIAALEKKKGQEKLEAVRKMLD